MHLNITEQQREGITILHADGRITAKEAGVLREKIGELLAAGQVRVILDMASVDYVDSTGLGAMVICFTQLKKAGGELKLMRLNRRNVELLALTKLHTVFEVFADEQDAVNSFIPGREIKRFDILNFVKEHSSDAKLS
jgi:anti-sigma B factor antagonist